MADILNYINGQWKASDSGDWIDNVEPATGQVYSRLPDSNTGDINEAVNAAQAAFPSWAGMTPERRSEFMLRIADLIDRDLEMLAQAESKDNGKTVKLAMKVDIPRASANMRFYATAIRHYASEAHVTAGEMVNYTVRSPHGVAGCISPWNLPLYLFTWKIAPALAAGNCVVAKPSELTPMTAYLFCKLCEEAGLPAGVLNVVHGTGKRAGQALVAHPKVPVISFTGGTVTGRHISGVAAPMFKKLSLELGGKNPNIVFADCNLEEAVSKSVESSFANQGEICLCGSRIMVEESIYDNFVDQFVEKANKLRVGDPTEETSHMGALVSEAHLEKVMGYVKLAKEEGGKIASGGDRVKLPGRCAAGYFHEPTIITGLDMHCRTNQEEIFGPVVTITSFKSEESAVAMANETAYGLSATLWTENLKRAHRVAHALHSGIVWVNCWLLRDLRTPFGGTKQSGVGREGGWDALDFFTEPKNICIKL
ncbi:aldehyde dehydrogenase [Fulvivirga sedimenti]|uniref:Aldehyde dehydrogenase n=1 Tax=Fulvivirga sedimenti TaxID=2879465 RepID=A0A9X1HX99_9BACT|nr:aldehyde dehydrogenase [Fulvivirga sedimenti]MCA6078142.1 aldehyde dehydrogenase [Fulvivirga sedimenti]